jgi:ML domain
VLLLQKLFLLTASNAQTLRPEVTAYAFGVRAVYELPDDRQIGCNWIEGTFCPLDQGEFATYNLVMPVVEEYPLTTLDIEVRMYDQNNVIQFCTLVECEVVLA